MNKILFKKKHRHCAICDEDEYCLLDVHRIAEGKEYSEANCAVLCVSCHRKAHHGNISIKEKRLSTAGYVIIWMDEDNQEQIKLI